MIFLIFTDERTESKYCRIYSLHEQVMIRVAMSILHDQKHAEDVVQDCFLEMLENKSLMEKLVDPDSPATKSYLLMMVKSRAINLYHKLKKQQISVIDDPESLLYQVEDKNADMDHILANAELLSDAKQYLSILDPLEVNLMTLKYYIGFQNKEIANILKMNGNHVGVKLYRIKQKLASIIRKANTSKETQTLKSAATGNKTAEKRKEAADYE
ncbi:MAG: polymerase sigma factor, sigma-70 family [Bacillota bacterium]|nr:polymerase sigma factor, sigma-70 family [Bacillota bacterium]